MQDIQFTAVKHEDNDTYFSVQLSNNANDLLIWLDIDKTGENPEWNKYIFHLNDPNDILQRVIQDNSDNFINAESITFDYLSKNNLLTLINQ